MTKILQIECTGYSIVADWYQGTNTDNIILVLPGYTSRRARQAEFTHAVVEQTGFSALCIDYSGHGDSPFELKETRPAQHLLEVVITYDWLRKAYPAAKISVVGSSYGGCLGAMLTKYRNVNKLVLRAPAILLPELFYTTWAERLLDEENYLIKLLAYRKDSVKLRQHPLLIRNPDNKINTLVVVHENDERIPKETTDAYIDAFGAESFIAKGFTHAVSQSPITQEQLESYQNRIADWLS